MNYISRCSLLFLYHLLNIATQRKKSNQLVEFSQDSASTRVGQGVILAKMLKDVNKLMCNTSVCRQAVVNSSR